MTTGRMCDRVEEDTEEWQDMAETSVMFGVRSINYAEKLSNA